MCHEEFKWWCHPKIRQEAGRIKQGLMLQNSGMWALIVDLGGDNRIVWVSKTSLDFWRGSRATQAELSGPDAHVERCHLSQYVCICQYLAMDQRSAQLINGQCPGLEYSAKSTLIRDAVSWQGLSPPTPLDSWAIRWLGSGNPNPSRPYWGRWVPQSEFEFYY